MDATNKNSSAQGIKSFFPSLPRQPPFPPHVSSSTGRGGKTDGNCAATGGISHVFALKPYGRFPNYKRPGSNKKVKNWKQQLQHQQESLNHK
jgi:hypothetical protein